MILTILLLLFFLVNIQSFSINNQVLRKPSSLKMMNPFPGSDIGIPLNIFQNVYTNLHYGHDITTIKNVLLQFLIGYYTYGNDRFKDAMDYKINQYTTTDNKKDLYKYIIDNEIFIKSSLDLTFSSVLFTLITDENFLINIPFILLLVSTDYYRDLKKKNTFIKPFYISALWTSCCIFLPCVLHDHNYSILNYPLDYLPCALTLFSLSIILDIKDIDEDKENGVNTFPVRYGKYKTSMISLLGLAISSILFGLNPHYLDRPLVNSINEIQNAGMAILPFLSSYNQTEI